MTGLPPPEPARVSDEASAAVREGNARRMYPALDRRLQATGR